MPNKIRKQSIRTAVGCLLAAVLMLSFLGLFPVTPVKADTKSSLEEARGYLSQIESELQDTRDELYALQCESDAKSENLAWMQARTEEQREVYEEALQQKNAALTVLQESETAYQAALDNLEDKQEQYEDRVSLMYQWNRKSLLEMFLSAESLQSFFTTVQFMKYICDADEQALQDLETATVLAEATRRQSEEALDECKRLLEEADAVLQAVEADEARAQQELDDARYSLSLTQQRVDELETSQSEASQNVDDYKAAYDREQAAIREAEEAARHAAATEAPTTTPASESNTSASGSEWSGGFVWPVPGCYGISSYYGWRTLFGYSDFHLGVDIVAGWGTPAVAGASGVVTYAGWLGSYGNVIMVDHGNGYSTRYAHLSGFNCYTGSYVEAGNVIGYIGSTGNSTGPHLHYEIRYYGSTVNPLDYY